MDIEQQGARCIGGICNMLFTMSQVPDQPTVHGSEGQFPAIRLLAGSVDIPNWSFRGGAGAHNVRSESFKKLVHTLQAYLASAGLRDFAHPDYPDIVFTVYARETLERERVTYRFLDWEDWPEGHVMMVAHRLTKTEDYVETR